MEKKRIAGMQILIFLMLFIYFIKISPLIPYDRDDWCFIGTMRLPIPIWKAFNPSKVLPETLMPIGGYIGSYIIYPLTHDYIGSIAIAESLIISIVATIMFYYFFKFIKTRLKLSTIFSLLTEIFFFFSFFLLFKHLERPSYNEFWTADLTCAFNYLIPGLFNATLYFYMLSWNDGFSNHYNKLTDLRKGILITYIFFTMFSSSQFNILTMICAFYDAVIVSFKDNLNLSFIKRIQSVYIDVVIIIMWVVTVLFDLYGKRASQVVHDQYSIINTMKSFKILTQEFNKPFILISALIILISICMSFKYIYYSNYYLTLIFEFIFTVLIIFIYLLIAYTKAGSLYAQRVDSTWPLTFLLLVIIATSLAFLVKNIMICRVLLPLVILLSSLIAFNFNCLPVLPLNYNHDSNTLKTIDNKIISQIVSADKKGDSKVTVNVPSDHKDSIMPIYIQNTLFTHHIIRTRLKISFKVDKKMDKLFENRKNEQPHIPLE